MKEHLVMSKKERDYKAILEHVKGGYFTLVEAASRLGISYRQAKRVYKRYKLQGDVGLVHLRRGCRSNRAKSTEFKERVLLSYKENYEGFGPTLAAEKLLIQGHSLHHDTLRKWLTGAGLWERKRRVQQHRSRRLRRPRFGELVQMDGSIHRWFGDDSPFCCLMNLVDDATGTTFALLAVGETTKAAMEVLKGWIELYGVPKALYVDLKNLYVGKLQLTDEQLIDIEKAFSVFQKACRRLGIEIIKAYSPEAKGRVERSHQVYQDRLVKEIRLQGLTQVQQVNSLLHNSFVADLNKRFAKEPAEDEDAHRPAPNDAALADIFVWDATRSVQKDYTIRYKNNWYQIAKTNPLIVRTGSKVTVRRHLDDTLTLWFKDERLPFRNIGAHKPDPATASQKRQLPALRKSEALHIINATTSPWRTYEFKCRRTKLAAYESLDVSESLDVLNSIRAS
jgi:molybdenum-dependent DNA-binding transcriptional regulator ModE